MKHIDVRSDTVTIPTENMKNAMLTSETGDDVFQTDPTVLELEKLAAYIVGKEDSVFTPTGTMANQIAILVHANGQKGKEVIVGEWQHIAWDENASHAVIAGTQLRQVRQNHDGEMSLSDIEDAIRKVESLIFPQTNLICVENTFHGKAVSLNYMQNVQNLAKKYNIPVHLDGARLFNAAHALNVDVKEITNKCDTLQFCLSKALCCPIGSILAGSKEFCQTAKKFRKLIGGTMRQSGVLAGPGIVALKEQIQTLKIDHLMAENFASQLQQIPQFKVEEYKKGVSTNMVFFQFDLMKFNNDNQYVQQFVDYMKSQNIIINNSWEPDYNYRFVFHYYIREKEVEQIIKAMENFVKLPTYK